VASTVLQLDGVIDADDMGTEIAMKWVEWNMLRAKKVRDWDEVRRYIFATDTTQTSNAALPWKNKTTTPKLCQIRDNLYANYMYALFPKRKWLVWEGDDRESEDQMKKTAIEGYMKWAVERSEFENTISQLIYDFIDYGNCFAMPEWFDGTVVLEDGRQQVGFVGPRAKRISPLDIVFNPTAAHFSESPKIIRSLVSLGEVKDILDKQTATQEDREMAQALWTYLRDLREQAKTLTGDLSDKDAYLSVDGFTSFRLYLESNYAEVLTFYGDIYDRENDVFLKNHVIQVVDRHKVISKKPNPSFFGQPPIFHAGWRPRQDNLWAQGPLDNLIGLQYRIDHLENMKADVMDLITYPPLKIKGYVEDFVWGPFEKIFIGDDGDVEMVAPPYNVLSVNLEIKEIMDKMEELAGAPKQALGVRTPGEKTAYEVQTLENASSRVFQAKTRWFETQIVEQTLNAMLELARRNVTANTIRLFDEEYKVALFLSLTPDDITGNGRIRPIAAKHFAERAELIQNISNFFGSALGQDPLVRQHFSTIKLAQLGEEVLDVADWKMVQPYIRISEQADAQRLNNAHQEAVNMEAGTPTGMGTDTGPPVRPTPQLAQQFAGGGPSR